MSILVYAVFILLICGGTVTVMAKCIRTVHKYQRDLDLVLRSVDRHRPEARRRAKQAAGRRRY